MKPIVIIKNINAPVSKVFTAIAHVEEFSKIVRDIKSIEFLSESKTGVGTRFRETRIMKGKEASTELEVTEYELDNKVRIVSHSHGTFWDTLFTVEENEGKTKLVVNMNASTDSIFLKLMNMLITGMVKKAIENDIEAVKSYCEES